MNYAHITQLDRQTLLRLQQVSSHFHRLASEQLYAYLNFRLPEGPHKALYRFTDALHTITTSDHDYAQHVRLLEVKPHSDAETFAQGLAHTYLHVDSPNKALNTLLLLLLRKAKGLERLK